MKTKQVLLNLGSGTITPREWINIDSSWNAWLHKYSLLLRIMNLIFPSNHKQLNTKWHGRIIVRSITKKLPFKDNSVDGIFLSHVLEHLKVNTCHKVLKECFRVLKPGKHIRVIVPDLKKLTNAYLDNLKNNPNSSVQYLDSLHFFLPEKMTLFEKIYFFLNNTDTHKWMYDSKSMREMLKSERFSNIKNCRFHSSKIPMIEKVEQENRFINAVCLEGKK